MAEDQVSERDAQQIDELHRKLLEQPRLEKAIDFNLCEFWKLIRPYWPIIVAAVRWIPKVGAKIADILEKLGQGLDHFCGIGGGNP